MAEGGEHTMDAMVSSMKEAMVPSQTSASTSCSASSDRQNRDVESLESENDPHEPTAWGWGQRRRDVVQPAAPHAPPAWRAAERMPGASSRQEAREQPAPQPPRGQTHQQCQMQVAAAKVAKRIAWRLLREMKVLWLLVLDGDARGAATCLKRKDEGSEGGGASKTLSAT